MKKLILKIEGMKHGVTCSDEVMLSEAVDALNNSICAHYGEKIVYVQEMAIVIELTGEVPFYIMELTKAALEKRKLNYTLKPLN